MGGGGVGPGYHWRLIGMVFCGCFFVFWWPVVLAIILLLFLWLQILCASWVLSKLTGEPPRLNGMISSSSQLSGCGVLSVRSMGLPQSAQIGIGPSAAICRALHLRRAAPFWYLPEPALLPMVFPSCVGWRWLEWDSIPTLLLGHYGRGIRGWLRSNDLRFWRPQLYLLSYAHRWSCPWHMTIGWI